MSKRGFTLIELLVVVAIIGILASVVLASLNTARTKARDTRRKSDLHQISLALEFYSDTNGTYVISGTGSGGVGIGWFAEPYPSYLSVAQGLVNSGFVSQIIKDPSGVLGGNVNGRSGYMIYADSSHYTLWANLENPSAADTATQNNCYHNNYDNYTGAFPASARTNYCISN